ncbi:MAG: putative lipoprotein [Ilumatobacteraceae bacterium]|nr:putative lipoprotein [Ilumatobacteraceae bacterium]
MTTSTRATRTRRGLVACAVVGGLLLAACSSDKDKAATTTAAPSGTSASTATTTEGSTADTAADTTTATSGTAAADTVATDTVTTDTATSESTVDTAATESSAAASGGLDCAGPAATGDAVKIGVLWPEGPTVNLPELGESAQAAMSYANDCLGGIGGHPVDVVGCKIDETNTASASDCANQMVEAGVAAVVVTITSSGSTIVPIITGAGIPYIVSGGASPEENINPANLVFGATGGVAADLGAMAVQAKNAGLDHIALLVTEGAAAGVGGLAGIPFGKAGVKADIVPIPAGTPDMTPQLTAALSGGAQATAVIGDSTLCISYLQAAASVDADGTHYVIATCIGDDVISAVGADAINGATVFENTDVSGTDAESTLYDAVMAKYSPKTPLGGFSPTGYVAALSLVRGVAGLTGDVTKDSIAAAMRATKGIAIPAGLGTTYSCATPPLPPLTAVCSSQALVGTITDGKISDLQVLDAGPLFAS